MTMTVRCGWCRRLKVDGRWVEAEPSLWATVTDGICPRCKQTVLADLEKRQSQTADDDPAIPPASDAEYTGL